MRAAPSGSGFRLALAGLCLLAAAALGGENPSGEPPLASATAAPITSAWIAAAVSLLAGVGAAVLLLQTIRRPTPPVATGPDPAMVALGRKVDRLQTQFDKLQRELAAERAAPGPEPEPKSEPLPEPVAEPAPVPETKEPEAARAMVGSPRAMIDELLDHPLPAPDGPRLQAFLAALLTVPDEIHEAFRGSPAEAAERIDSRREALDQALYERWPSEAMQQACASAEGLEAVDWESVASWVRKRQEQAIEELAGHGLRRFAPPPMALLSPDTAVPSDEPPLITHNPDLRDRVASVSPGNGGWRIGQEVVCRARARLYEFRPEAEA